MDSFETLTTVGERGQVLVSGVPFAPGTQVTISISPSVSTSQSAASELPQLAALFAALDKSRNTQTVSNFRRDEIYDRDVLR